LVLVDRWKRLSRTLAMLTWVAGHNLSPWVVAKVREINRFNASVFADILYLKKYFNLIPQKIIKLKNMIALI
jgi:hypothetical protein